MLTSRLALVIMLFSWGNQMRPSTQENILSYIFNQKSPHKEIYISVDIEADGPTPLDGNMISLAAIATDLDLNILGVFEANLEPHIEPNPIVMNDFWVHHPQQYQRTQVRTVTPKEGMKSFITWMTSVGQGHSISMMALPMGFDKMFIQAYAVKFGGKNAGNLDGVGGIDIESLIMMYKKTPSYRNIDHTIDVPELRQSGLNLTHNALEDALDQTVIGVNLLRINQDLKPKFIDQEIIDEIMEKSNAHFGQLTHN